MMQGAVIGWSVPTLGTASWGCWDAAFLDWYEYPLETDVYYLSTLPVVVDPVHRGRPSRWVGLRDLLSCAPSTRRGEAASLDPVEGLRYE